MSTLSRLKINKDFSLLYSLTKPQFKEQKELDEVRKKKQERERKKEKEEMRKSLNMNAEERFTEKREGRGRQGGERETAQS